MSRLFGARARCFVALAVASSALGGLSSSPVGAAQTDGPAGSSAAPRVLIAFLPTRPAPKLPLLGDLDRRGFAVGLTSVNLGGYSRRQQALDIGQGTRIAASAYARQLGRLDLVETGDGGRISGWTGARRRAAEAPGELVPGLLAQTIVAAGGRVSYAGVVGFEQLEAIAAADRSGRIRNVSLGTTGTFAARAGALWQRSDLLVARLPAGETGLRALERLVAGRRAGDLTLVLAVPEAPRRLLVATGAAGGRYSGTLRSRTTRRDGLIAATDIAPTALRQLGLSVPAEMQGEQIESRPDGTPDQVRALAARLDVVAGRRGGALRSLLASWLALLACCGLAGRRRGARAGLRLGLLAVLWVPGVALITAAIAPSRAVELAAISVGSLGLAAMTDRLVPWPAGPVLPAALVFAAHALDLARGSPLVAASLAGSNPQGGARFYGVGNELETILSVSVLLGAGAALTRVRREHAERGFAAAGIVAAAVIGSGRLGADVGGVITLAAGTAAAMLSIASARPSARRLAALAAAPVLTLLGLVALDLATGGGAHLTRSVIEADDPLDLVDVAVRRYGLALHALERGAMPLLVALAVGLLAVGVAKRRTLLAPLARRERHSAFRSGLVGAFAATVVGALANDSGPAILLIGTVMIALAAGYAWAQPPPAGEPPPRPQSVV